MTDAYYLSTLAVMELPNHPRDRWPLLEPLLEEDQVEAKLGRCALPKARTIPIPLGICKWVDLVGYYFRMLTGSRVAVSTQDFPPTRDGLDILLLINDLYVFSARPLDGFPPGHISMSDPQRTWAGVAFTDTVKVQIYDPFSQGGQAYLGSTDIEVGFAGKKRVETPYDQDDLANVVIKVCLGFLCQLRRPC